MLATTALVAAIATAAGGGWWLLRVDAPREAARAAQIADADRATTSLIAELHAQRETIEELRRVHTQAAARADSLEAELARVAARADAPRTLDEDGLRVGRIDHLIRSAALSLTLTRDVAAARTALTAARDSLDETSPLENTLRAAIAQILAELDRVAEPGVLRLEAEWASAQTGLDKLPVRAAARAEVPQTPVDGWRGVVSAIWQDLLGLVEIRRVEEADTALLDPARRALALAELRQEIGLLRAALVQRDAAAVRASVAVLSAGLDRSFAPEAPEVQALKARLETLESLDLDPRLPSLAPCLDLLPAVHAEAAAKARAPAAAAAPMPSTSGGTDTLPPPATPRDIM
jgi:uncharacterized protein HemX